MKAIEVIPNVVTYNTLIDGYGRDGKIEMGLRLFEEMGKRGLKADILTYNALILGLCKDGKTKKAAHLVKELDKAGLAPNASTFSALIYGQCVSEKPDRGLQLLRSMIRSGFGPNYETFVMLITSFCKCEDLDVAVQVLKVIKESMALSSATLAQICSGLCGKGNDQLALKLYKEIHTRDLLTKGLILPKSSLRYHNETPPQKKSQFILFSTAEAAKIYLACISFGLEKLLRVNATKKMRYPIFTTGNFYKR